MNKPMTITASAELSDTDLESITGGCHRRCDDDYDRCYDKPRYCEEDRSSYCEDDSYKSSDDNYDYCYEKPRHHRRHSCN